MVKRIIVVAVLVAFGCVVWAAKQGADAIDVIVPKTVNQDIPCEDPNVVGVEPDGAPEFRVDRELRMVGAQNVMFLTVTESHGWYADYVYVRLRYEEEDADGRRRMVGTPINYLMKGYLDFGKTLEDRTTLLYYEFGDLKELGTTENWHVKVVKWRKVLAPKPE